MPLLLSTLPLCKQSTLWQMVEGLLKWKVEIRFKRTDPTLCKHPIERILHLIATQYPTVVYCLWRSPSRVEKNSVVQPPPLRLFLMLNSSNSISFFQKRTFIYYLLVSICKHKNLGLAGMIKSSKTMAITTVASATILIANSIIYNSVDSS